MTEYRHLHPKRRMFVATALAGAITQVHAAGFALIEQGVSGLGSAYAGAAASAEDASTIFYNPAGLTYLQGSQFVVAGHLVKPSAEFSGSATTALGAPITGGMGGDAGDLALVPNLYYSRRLPNDFVFGLGINAPFGLKTEYDADWVGRYHAIESEVKTVNINPSIAYKAAPNLSVGVGVSAQYIEATLSQAVDQNSVCVARQVAGGVPVASAIAGCAAVSGDATGTVEGDDWSFGYNIGIIYEAGTNTRVGFAYRSKIKQELEGDAAFANAHPAFTMQNVFVPTSVTADVTLPETASLSLYHAVSPTLALLADVSWTRWSRFDELRIQYASAQPDSVTPENWDNSVRYSLGLHYRYNSAWLLRAGLAYDEEPIPDAQHRTPRIPGNDRTWLAFGANYRYSPALSFDVGYAHLFVDDTPIDASTLTAGTLIGTYDADVNILSAQVNWSF